MPSPSSDAIASDIGHGALGVRYGLRPIRDLLGESAGQRHVWVELRPKKLLASGGWTDQGGGNYTQTLTDSFDGVSLHVVGCRTSTETLAFVDPGTGLAAGQYTWAMPLLWVHLTGGIAPSGVDVVVEFGLSVGTHGVVHPVLGPSRLANGSLEAWTGTTPDGWSTAVGTGITRDKTTVDPLQGSYAVRFTLTAVTSAVNGYILQDFTTLIAGQVYRLSGAYRNTCAVANGLLAVAYVYDAGTVYLGPDGRTDGAAAAVFADSVGTGEWKRFTYDFVCPSWTTVRLLFVAVAASGTQTGTIDWDDLKLQHVGRYAYHEPLLVEGGAPAIESARGDAFWGPISNGYGSIALTNAAGRFNSLLSTYDWLGAVAVVKVGGRFYGDGNEILIDDAPIVAMGKLAAPIVSDTMVAFDLEDDRRLLERPIPLKYYDVDSFADLAEADQGRPRPLVFGSVYGVRPAMVDVNTWLGVPLGTYEVADCSDWTAGIKEITTVHWYVDERAADAQDTSRRVSFTTSGTDYSTLHVVNLTTGRFDVHSDMRPIEITEENNKLVFDIGGSALTASITPGIYYLYDSGAISGVSGLVATIQAAMIAAGGGSDIGCTFDTATAKVKISKGAGTLNLLCATGSDVQTGIWALLGFDASADKTGSLSYSADNVWPAAPESHVIRCDVIGYVDDASGTYTGTAGAVIKDASDIARFLIQSVLGQPSSAIDSVSFAASRSAAAACGLYVGALSGDWSGSRTLRDVIEVIETSADADVMLIGGVWYFKIRDASVPANVVSLVDRDYLDFAARYVPEDLYETVRITYAMDPATGRERIVEGIDTSIGLRFDRPYQRSWRTCLVSALNAAARRTTIKSHATTKRRRFLCSVPGRLLLTPLGDKVQLSRTYGLGPSGTVASVLTRILSKRDDWGAGISTVEMIEILEAEWPPD